jgi:hypothetical protein
MVEPLSRSLALSPGRRRGNHTRNGGSAGAI